MFTRILTPIQFSHTRTAQSINMELHWQSIKLYSGVHKRIWIIPILFRNKSNPKNAKIPNWEYTIITMDIPYLFGQINGIQYRNLRYRSAYYKSETCNINPTIKLRVSFYSEYSIFRIAQEEFLLQNCWNNIMKYVSAYTKHVSVAPNMIYSTLNCSNNIIHSQFSHSPTQIMHYKS